LIDTTLPLHAVTGTQAVGWRKARRDETGPQPIWPILGGSEDNDADADTGNSEDGDAVAADQGDDNTDGQDADGDEDWKAKFEAQQRINRNLERRTRRDARRIADLEVGKKDTSAKDTKPGDKPGDVDVEKIRSEAREQARQEALQEALKERVLDKIEAKAKEFADPADAVAMLMRGRTVDEFIDGDKIDVDAIQDALTELLEKKPYLGAAQGGKRFQGSAEGGPKSHKPTRPKSLAEAIQRSYSSK
jgi:hypothetical protein